MPKNLEDIQRIDPNKHPLPNIKIAPPLKGFSKLKDEPAVSGSNSADGDGVLGDTSHGGVGVHGQGDAGTGVLGECNAGRGVAGLSKTGIGVYGKGGQFAGLFEGDVEIIGNLVIQGVSIQTWIQRLQELEAASGITNAGLPVTRPAARPSITVEQGSPASGGGTTFTIRGGGFLSESPIDLQVAKVRTEPTVIRDELSDRNGALFIGSRSIACQPGDLLTFSATDRRTDLNDLTGMLWSSPIAVPVY